MVLKTISGSLQVTENRQWANDFNLFLNKCDEMSTPQTVASSLQQPFSTEIPVLCPAPTSTSPSTIISSSPPLTVLLISTSPPPAQLPFTFYHTATLPLCRLVPAEPPPDECWDKELMVDICKCYSYYPLAPPNIQGRGLDAMTLQYLVFT